MTVSSSTGAENVRQGDAPVCPHCHSTHPITANFCSSDGSLLAPRSRSHHLHLDDGSLVTSCASDRENTVFFVQGVLLNEKSVPYGVYLLLHETSSDSIAQETRLAALSLVSTFVLHPLTRGLVDGDIMAWLRLQIQRVNASLYTSTKGTHYGMAFTVALLIGRDCYIANSGDVRVLLLRQSVLRQVLSKSSTVTFIGDQETFFSAVDDTEYKENEHGLGYAPDLYVDIVQEKLLPEDRLVFCSETMVSATDIEQVLPSCDHNAQAASLMTMTRGSRVEVSALVVHLATGSNHLDSSPALQVPLYTHSS